MAFAKQRQIWCGLILITASCSVGCTLCSNPFDCDYVTYGSRTPRHDMKHGRVGSVLSDSSMNDGGPVESIDAIDMGYAEVLEGNDAGPIFSDEPLDDSSVLRIGPSGPSSGPILLGPAK